MRHEAGRGTGWAIGKLARWADIAGDRIGRSIGRLVARRHGAAAVWIALAAVSCIFITGRAEAQQSAVSVRPMSPREVPWFIAQNVAAMGDRLWNPGKERLTIAGVFSDSNGDAATEIVLQVPGLCRLDINGKNGPQMIGFNGVAGWLGTGKPDRASEAILESFSDDSTEGLLGAVAEGQTLWLAGSRTRLHDPDGGPGTPQFVDVYGSLREVKQRQDRVVRRKMYCFDSQTQLLNRVVYASESGTGMVETIFEGWEQVQGQAVPLVWKRKDNGRLVFSFRRSSAVFSSGSDTGPFKNGN